MTAAVVRQVGLALRRMRREPGTTFVLVATLGLGLGANAVVFGLADAVLLRNLPFPEPDRLVALHESQRGSAEVAAVADGNFADLHAQASSLRGVAAHLCGPMLVGVANAMHRVPTCGITADFFPVLGIAPALGRVSSSELSGDGPASEAVISFGFWQALFGADPRVLDRTLVVLGQPVPIVGVMPKGFAFPAGTDVWVRYEAALGTSRTAHNLQVVARLAPGVTLPAARAQLAAVGRQLAEIHGAEIGEAFELRANSLHAELSGDHAEALVLLACTVALVLLIAGGNVAALLLVRNLGALGELAIRQALGASRARLGLELLVESLVLGLAGALVSLALAGGVFALLAPLVPAEVLVAGPPVVDLRLALFALLLGGGTGALCGLPALQLTRRNPRQAFQGAPIVGDAVCGSRRLIGAFVVFQYGLSLVALGTAGLFVKSLNELLRTDPGFRTRGLLLAEAEVPLEPPSRYADAAALVAYREALRREIASLPGVEQVSLARPLPLVQPQSNGLALREGESETAGEQVWPDYRIVGPEHFAALQLPIVLGREFTASDTSTSEPVAVVNQLLARRLWGDANPLDRRLTLPGLEATRRLLRVVGVVGDARFRALELEPRPAVYVPWPQHLAQAGDLGVIVVASGDPARLTQAIRERIRALDPHLPPGRVRPIDEVLRASHAERRLRTDLLGAFAGLALVLAVIGVYGVMSYSLFRRRRELALRSALGARPGELRAMVVRDGLRFVLAGQLLGVLLWPLNLRLLQGALFGVRSTDPGVLAAVSLGLALIVLGTCYAAARRVSLSSPGALLKET